MEEAGGQRYTNIDCRQRVGRGTRETKNVQEGINANLFFGGESVKALGEWHSNTEWSTHNRSDTTAIGMPLG